MLRVNSPIEWCVVRTLRRFTCHVNIHRYMHTRHGASALETTTFLKIFILFYFILFFTQIFCLPFIFLSFSVSWQLAYVCCACHSPSQSRMALYYCCLQRSCMYGSFVIIELLLPQGEESARTLGVLDVDEQKERFNVNNTRTSKQHNIDFTDGMISRVCRYPRYSWWAYPIIKASYTGIEIVLNLRKCRVPVPSLYQTIPECSARSRARY